MEAALFMLYTLGQLCHAKKMAAKCLGMSEQGVLLWAFELSVKACERAWVQLIIGIIST